MWSANLLRRHLSFNHFGHHRIFHLQSQWNAVRCFSHNTSSNANASGLPVRYISKRPRQQSTSSPTHIALHQGIPSTSHGKMLKTQGPILNHWDGHQKGLTDEQHIKVHNQVVDSAQEIAHIEGIKLNQEFSSHGLVHEQCMQATDELFHVDKKQSTPSLTHISLLDAVPSTSDSTLFRPTSFQGLPVDRTEGKMPNTEGPILNHSDGHGKHFTDKVQIKVRKQIVDCMTTGQEIAHTSLTYKSGGLPEDIKLNQEFSSDGLVHEQCMQATEELFRKQVVDCMRTGQEIAHTPLTDKSGGLPEGIKLNQEFSSDGLVHEQCMQATEELFHVDKKQSTSSLTHISLLDALPSTSDSTVFRPNSFQGLPVDRTEGKMPNTEGPILNHSDGHGKDFTDKEQIKVRKQVVDCMTTGQEIAHTPLTYKSGGLPEGIKLNQELSCDGLVDVEYMEATDEVFEDVQSNDTYFKAKPDKTRKGAEKLAVDLLAKRAVTAVELRKKLVAKLFPLNIVEAVLRDFQGRGLINDGLYAETFSHSRWKSSSWGPRRIKQALSQKGVTEHDVKKTVKLVFEDSEEVEQGSGVRLSSSSLDQLYIQASKQWQRGHDAHPEKRKARVIRWLQYRGFDWGVIGSIIKKLESKHPRATLP